MAEHTSNLNIGDSMNHKDKALFIINDYMKVMDEIGTMPCEKILAEKWFDESFRANQDKFVKKYANNSMKNFASRLALAYGDVVEKELKDMFTPPNSH